MRMLKCRPRNEHGSLRSDKGKDNNTWEQIAGAANGFHPDVFATQQCR